MSVLPSHSSAIPIIARRSMPTTWAAPLMPHASTTAWSNRSGPAAQRLPQTPKWDGTLWGLLTLPLCDLLLARLHDDRRHLRSLLKRTPAVCVDRGSGQVVSRSD